MLLLLTIIYLVSPKKNRAFLLDDKAFNTKYVDLLKKVREKELAFKTQLTEQ